MAEAYTVVVEINQQQRQLIERLIAEGGYGSNVAEAIRLGFARFCEAHPEFLAPSGRAPEGPGHGRA